MPLKKIILLFLLIFCNGRHLAQIKLCSWNLENFGKSKSDSAVRFIADVLKDYDIVAVVEVVAKNGGAKAVARLADELNRKGSKWDYCISDPTVGAPNKSERYAFLWKTQHVKKNGRAWLDTNYKWEIEREPYFADFISEGKEFTVAAFHAVPKNRQPEAEIKYFRFLPGKYPAKKIIFCGDFNCPESHTVFDPIKSLSFHPALIHQKTTLKNDCVNQECLASEYDNFFYDTKKIHLTHSGVVRFYRNFATLKAARKISDHLPVFLEFKVK